MIKQYLQIFPKYIAFFLALAGTLGSLYFSEFQKLEPCHLCWYQRILLYPIVVIMLVGVFRKDAKMYLYTAPLAFIGWLFALYHYLLQKTSLFTQIDIGCSPTNPCNVIDVEYLGFITIPFMSLVAFTVILVCNYIMHRYGTKFE